MPVWRCLKRTEKSAIEVESLSETKNEPCLKEISTRGKEKKRGSAMGAVLSWRTSGVRKSTPTGFLLDGSSSCLLVFFCCFFFFLDRLRSALLSSRPSFCRLDSMTAEPARSFGVVWPLDS